MIFDPTEILGFDPATLPQIVEAQQRAFEKWDREGIPAILTTSEAAIQERAAAATRTEHFIEHTKQFNRFKQTPLVEIVLFESTLQFHDEATIVPMMIWLQHVDQFLTLYEEGLVTLDHFITFMSRFNWWGKS